MKPLALATAILFGLSAWGSAQAAEPDELQAREQAAAEAARELIDELFGELQAALEEDGPPGAIRVCRDLAPEVKNRISLERGWKVTRVGTRVRNPLLGTPDAWEQEVLREFEERRAAGEPMEEITHSEVVTEPDGDHLRFMRAIGVRQECLACHGARDELHDGAYRALREHYPHDRAVGYEAGELRGALSIKQPLDVPLER